MADFNAPLSGLRSAQIRQDVTANNLANALTPAFQPSRAGQVDQAGGGSRIASIRRAPGPGGIDLTGGPLDVTIRGEGFFEIDTAQGTRFTRDGSFRVDGAGRLVTAGGGLVRPGIQIPADARGLQISADGAVRSIAADGSLQDLGRLRVSRFNNPGGLSSVGDNQFAPTAASGAPISGAPGEGGFGSLLAGALESSGVDLAAEIVQTILNRTAFQVNLPVLKAQDEMLGEIVDLQG